MYYNACVPLTVRLGPRTQRTLNSLTRSTGLSRSDVVREALAHYAARGEGDAERRPYAAWADVIGVVSLGVRDPLRTTGEQFADVVRARARARSR
jgi:hypothetical protein